MAEMLPPDVPEASPTSEKRIFQMLKDDPACASWIVFHSLLLVERGIKKPFGELDFLVIIPREGILCLEIKGGRVSQKNGVWETTNRNNKTDKLKRSPYAQVRDGMFAVSKFITENSGPGDLVRDTKLYSAVVFTDVDKPKATIEYNDDDAIGASELVEPISKSLMRLLIAQRKRTNFGTCLNDPASVRAIRQMLRPDFELRLSRSARIRRDCDQLVRLTEEQWHILDAAAENPRILTKGSAGTGKTFVALQMAKQHFDAGERVACLCFNRMFGNWLKRQLLHDTRSAITGSVHEVLISLIRRANLYSEYRSVISDLGAEKIFRETLPSFAIKAIIELGEEIDYLVLDEAQDLLKPELLEVFDLLLKGGLSKGQWLLAGDFERQAIYASGKRGDELLSSLDPHTSSYYSVKLRQNCRNTKRIAESIMMLSGFDATSAPFRLNQIDGEPVQQSFAKDATALEQLLEKQVAGLINAGMNTQDMIILSPHKFANSSASKIKIDGITIRDMGSDNDYLPTTSEIPFSTIHAFKGMESQAVIITDIDAINDEYSQSLLYTGMSRASGWLSMLLHEDTREPMKQLVRRNLTAENI